MKSFFTADTHFGSERVRDFSQRPFATVEEMDSAMIANWNEMVTSEDIVYHLGDFGEYQNISKLNGKVVLLMGNYEKNDMLKNFNGDFKAFKKHMLSIGFADVVENGMIIDNPIFGEKVFLNHFPMECRKDMFNFFAHIHGLCLVKEFGVNVGIDNYNFKPATEEVLAFYKKSVKNVYDINVFCGMKDLKDKNIELGKE